MPLILPQTCSNCRYFDGDKHCAHWRKDAPLSYIERPHRVVCDLHEPKTSEATDDGA